MNRIRTVIWVGIVWLASCGGEKSASPPADPDGIEVVFAGNEPRRVARYTVTKGDTIDVELSIDVELDAGGLGGPLPTVILGTQIIVDDVLPDQSARIRATVASIRARAVANSTLSAESMEEHMQLLKGTTFVGSLSPDGGVRELHAEAAQRLPPNLAQQLETVTRAFQQIALPLPRIPIGSGAAWRQKRTIQQNGMTLYTVTTIVASAIDERAITFTSTTSLGGPDQKVTLAGTTIDMTSIGGVGNGKGTLDLAKLVMTGEQTLAFHSDMTAGGETDAMAMTMTTRVAPGKLPEPPPVEPAPTDDDEPPPDDLAAPDNTEASGENESMPDAISGAAKPTDAPPADAPATKSPPAKRPKKR